METAKVVIGSGYGDEGKGLVADFLSQTWADIVVRFNGGSQALHTVKRPSGLSHAFSHFGSGSLTGIPTYLSQHFVVNPATFMKEYKELEKKVKVPTIFVHEDCIVTTLLDMRINQAIENFRRYHNQHHGSVGVGINETITRHLNTEYKITVGMLANDLPKVLKIIEDIYNDYAVNRLISLGMAEDAILEIKEYDLDKILDGARKQIEFFTSHAIIVERDDRMLDYYDNVVFEGAQGLMLDEFHPNFPYVTRSRTGIFNVNEILKDYKNVKTEIYYVSRIYATRHGAGPFPTEVTDEVELFDFPYEFEDSTNVPHPYQGTMRIGYLDVDVLKKTIYDDLNNFKGYPDAVRLVVTCMDQVWYDVVIQQHGVLVTMEPQDFGAWMKKFIGFPVMLNYSDKTPKDMDTI
jgi:adenylosuccinate synthase